MSINAKLQTVKEISSNGGLIGRFLKARLSKYDFFWNRFNKDSRRKFMALETELDDFAQKVVSEVYQQGFSVRKLDDFLTNQEIKLLYDDVDQRYTTTPRQRGDDWSLPKNYLEYYKGGFYPKESQDLNLDNPFDKLAIHETVLKIVNSYFNSIGRLCYIELNKCAVLNRDDSATGSQRVHRDPAFRTLMKVFVYWNDISEDGGAFTYMPETHIHGKYGHIAPNKKLFGGSYYPELSLYNQLEQKKLSGLRGSIIFGDPAGLHYGGKSYDTPRKLSTFVYYPEADTINIIKPKFNIQGLDNSNNLLSKRQKLCLEIN